MRFAAGAVILFENSREIVEYNQGNREVILFENFQEIVKYNWKKKVQHHQESARKKLKLFLSGQPASGHTFGGRECGRPGVGVRGAKPPAKKKFKLFCWLPKQDRGSGSHSETPSINPSPR